MRIAFYNYHWDVEGGARGAVAQLRSMAEHLERRGHVVDIRFRAARKPGAAAVEQTVGLKRIGLLRRYGHVPKLLLRNGRFIREEKTLLADFKADVVLAVSAFCNYSALAAARALRLPFVLFSEAPLQYEYQMFFREYCNYGPLTRYIEGRNIRRADQVIVVTEILKGYLMRYGAPATRLHVVPNGVDVEKFRPTSPDRELLQELGLQDRVVTGFVGSFNFFADVEAFAAQVARVCAERPEAAFLFVGKGEAGDRLRDRLVAAGLGHRAVFAGAVEHALVPRYLSLMDITVAPYRGDYLFYGSALKPLEYMAAGKATVVSALGQCRELISDGHNGMLFQWDDYAELGERLIGLTGDAKLRRSLGENARRTIERDWTWERQAARIERVLELACAARRRPAQ